MKVSSFNIYDAVIVMYDWPGLVWKSGGSLGRQMCSLRGSASYVQRLSTSNVINYLIHILRYLHMASLSNTRQFYEATYVYQPINHRSARDCQVSR